jgi:hypothetical protein
MISDRPRIKRFALRALLQMDGTPMPQTTLIDSIQLAVPNVMESDINTALRELEADQLMSGNKDELIGITWTLTDKGLHKAKQL